MSGCKRWKWIFWLYIAFLVVFVVVKFDGSVPRLLQRMEQNRAIRATEPGYNLNFIALRTIRSQLRYIRQGWAVRNLVGNIAVFVPMGLLLPLAHRHIRKFFAVIAICFVSICAIEAVQYLTLLGSCDVDDLILNLLGCVLGWLCFLPMKER